MSKWNKLIDEILLLNKNLRFTDLAKALKKIGYTQNQPKMAVVIILSEKQANYQ